MRIFQRLEHPPAHHLRGAEPSKVSRGCSGAGFVVRYFVQRRNVNPVYPGKFLEKLRPWAAFSLPLPVYPNYVDCQFLSVAKSEGVHEIRERLRRHGARPPCDDNGMPILPVFRPERDPPQIQHGEDIGVRQFILQGEAYNVKTSQGRPAFHGKERPPFLPEEVLHIRPRHVDALTRYEVQGVQERIENQGPQMTDPHLIHIREGQGKCNIDGSRVLADGSRFPAYISRRLLNLAQMASQVIPRRSHKSHLLQ